MPIGPIWCKKPPLSWLGDNQLQTSVLKRKKADTWFTMKVDTRKEDHDAWIQTWKKFEIKLRNSSSETHWNTCACKTFVQHSKMYHLHHLQEAFHYCWVLPSSAPCFLMILAACSRISCSAANNSSFLYNSRKSKCYCRLKQKKK